jgi:3-hydroxyisobutyrate dehydrogenase-like beta-hydroxyacid dehydrogenase
MTSLALIGLGEVGRAMAEELASTDPAGTTCWDTAFVDPTSRASTNRRATGLSAAANGRAAVTGAAVVISAVTPDNALAAAQSVADTIPSGCWYLDLNSASPGQKQAAAEVIDRHGGRYVEAALMSPINPRRLAAPILLGGPHAQPFAEIGAQLGFTNLEVYSPTVGPAAATKLCRSVVVKGLESLLVEALVAARAWGVEDRVLQSLSNLIPVADWPQLAAYMVSRSLEHGTRRAEEMRQAAHTVADTGLTPAMATAAADQQEWAGRRRTAANESDLIAMIDDLRSQLPDFISVEPTTLTSQNRANT